MRGLSTVRPLYAARWQLRTQVLKVSQKRVLAGAVAPGRKVFGGRAAVQLSAAKAPKVATVSARRCVSAAALTEKPPPQTFAAPSGNGPIKVGINGAACSKR